MDGIIWPWEDGARSPLPTHSNLHFEAGTRLSPPLLDSAICFFIHVFEIPIMAFGQSQ